MNYSGHFRICAMATPLMRLRKDGTRRGRRQMTAAERRSVSVRMKKYWAERRQKNGATKRGPGRPKGSGKRKGISAAGRAAIAAAQKKRWAAIAERGQGQGEGHGRELRRQRVNSQAPQFTTPPFGGGFVLYGALFIQAG